MTENQYPWYESYPEDVAHTIGEPEYDSLYALFEDKCHKYANKTAFTSFGTSMTFREVNEKVDAFASYLQNELHVKKGDALGVILPNLIQYPICVFAGLKCGMRIVNVNPLYTAHEILSVLRDSKAQVVVTLESINARLLQIHDQTYIKTIISCNVGDYLGSFKGAFYNFAFRYLKRSVPSYDKKQIVSFKSAVEKGYNLGFSKVDINIDDVAFYQYTGGTTGKPKGAMLTHRNIISNVMQADAMYSPILNYGEETILTALPLYHIFAMTINLMFALYIGCSNILIADPRQFNTVISALKRNSDVSIIIAVNTLLNAFVTHDVFKKVKLNKLRLVVGGGTAVQEGVAKKFKEVSGVSVLEGYGLTECSPLCCALPYNNREYNGTIGVPTPSTIARIVDIHTGEEITQKNMPGELEFKGPQVMKGYFNNQKETEHVFDGEFLRTGDIAVWCDGGFIKIIDRIKDMIIVSGFNVFPNEIENVVSMLNGVIECGVVGVPSSSTGESVKLYIVRKDKTLTKELVLLHLKKYLTGYKIPKHIEFVEKLPKSPVGKVLRRYLRQNRFDS